MSASSGRSNSAFFQLSVRNASILLDVLRKNTLHDRAYIKDVFQKRAQDFDPTVNFLLRLGIIKKAQKESGLVLAVDPEGDLMESLRRRLLERRTRYRTELAKYLTRFDNEDGHFIRRATVEERSQEAPTRNFLMELGMVKYDHTTKAHVIASEHVVSFLQLVRMAKIVPPEALKRSLADRDTIGFAAEELVLEYEKTRLPETLSKRVEHVSVVNAATGYDIRSFSADEMSISPRLIEVKAVPHSSFDFYWTENEIAVARSLGDYYYLYLVPVSRGTPDISKLVIVCDPVMNVLENNAEWCVESNVLHCAMRTSS